MKIRPAGSMMLLEEAIVRGAEVRTMYGLRRMLYAMGWDVEHEHVTITKYGEGIDQRCGWDTHLVCVGGKAALFSDGPLIGPRRGETE